MKASTHAARRPSAAAPDLPLASEEGAADLFDEPSGSSALPSRRAPSFHGDLRRLAASGESRRARERLISLLSLGVSLALLAGAAGWPPLAPTSRQGLLWPALGLVLCGAACGLHRPLAGWSLGAGAVVVPTAAALLGPLPAAWVAGGALAGADLGRRLIERQAGLPERRRRVRPLVGAAHTALAALAAALLWTWGAPVASVATPAGRLVWVGFAAGLVYVALVAGLELADRALRQVRRRLLPAPFLLPFSLDLLAWTVGLFVALVAVRMGAGVAALLLATLALLCLEAARGAHLLSVSRQRLCGLEKAQRAGHRLASEGHEMAAVADRIRRECKRLVPFLWFQFELDDPELGTKSWCSGPDDVLREGRAKPERSPPALRGIHRRSIWRVIERELEAGGRVAARVCLWCDPRRLEPDAVKLLEALFPQMAASIQHAQLDRAATRDPLTGVAVRRVLDRRLVESFERCREEGSAMAVVMCDLDHFKSINDAHGHAAGDRALVAFARLLDAERREGDLAARYGGEEFTLLLPQTDGETALGVAERLRRRVAELTLAVEGVEVPLRMSAGVAAFPEVFAPTAAELVMLADEALYEAKRQGRDRCLRVLGPGRFRDLAGREVAGAESAAAAPAPRIFA